MAGSNVQSVNSAPNGERRVLKTGAGPAASSRTETALAPEAILEQWENGGNGRSFGVRADGRLILPKFNGTPTNVSDGDFWIEDNGGTLELHYQDGAVDTVIGSGSGSGGGGGNFELIPDTVSLPKGYAVRSRDDGGTTKSGLATAGAGSVAGELYEAIGLLASTVPGLPNPPTDPLRVVLPGQTIELTSGEINTITGAPALVLSRTYFLSTISGRWVLDPVGAGVEVVVPIGRALTPTTLLVDLGMPIVL